MIPQGLRANEASLISSESFHCKTDQAKQSDKLVIKVCLTQTYDSNIWHKGIDAFHLTKLDGGALGTEGSLLVQ
jgi:hypothetical protein